MLKQDGIRRHIAEAKRMMEREKSKQDQAFWQGRANGLERAKHIIKNAETPELAAQQIENERIEAEDLMLANSSNPQYWYYLGIESAFYTTLVRGNVPCSIFPQRQDATYMIVRVSTI